MSGEADHRAAAEVIQIDALVCEDSMKHNKPLCRSPTDYETIFNIIERPSAEAVDECMGVPYQARSMTGDAFDHLQITIETRWGEAPAIIPDRGFLHGFRSAVEQSKLAQSLILNLRANSVAFYVTDGGIEVHAAGYVDDTNHYGKGINDLVIIMEELGLGSIATGIGFA